jgi:hypothetical protein
VKGFLTRNQRRRMEESAAGDAHSASAAADAKDGNSIQAQMEREHVEKTKVKNIRCIQVRRHRPVQPRRKPESNQLRHGAVLGDSWASTRSTAGTSHRTPKPTRRCGACAWLRGGDPCADAPSACHSGQTIHLRVLAEVLQELAELGQAQGRPRERARPAQAAAGPGAAI